MPTGKLGIGHTRWATHGKPTYINAHPHTDCHGKIFVVHNGIIENFAELKAELEAEGHEFPSETDTEVVPHLIEKYYKGDFLAAVRAALKRMKGAYALAMFSSDDPELLVGARLNAPLVVGLGENENYIASDITAIIPYTKRVLVLGEGEVAAVTPLGAEVSSLDGVTVKPKIVHVDWDVTQAQKNGFAHFMLGDPRDARGARQRDARPPDRRRPGLVPRVRRPARTAAQPERGDPARHGHVAARGDDRRVSARGLGGLARARGRRVGVPVPAADVRGQRARRRDHA